MIARIVRFFIGFPCALYIRASSLTAFPRLLGMR
jgi:hypothetical protein